MKLEIERSLVEKNGESSEGNILIPGPSICHVFFGVGSQLYKASEGRPKAFRKEFSLLWWMLCVSCIVRLESGASATLKRSYVE